MTVSQKTRENEWDWGEHEDRRNNSIQGLQDKEQTAWSTWGCDVVFYIIVVMPFYEPFDIIYLQSQAISVPENDSHQGAKDVLSFN